MKVKTECAPWARSMILAVILLLAAGLRLWALGFGLPSWFHPDDYSFVFFPLQFFSGDLNPHFFTYPTLHYYLLGLLYGLYFCLQKFLGAGYSLEQFLALHYFWDRTQLMWIARLVNALLGVGTVAWTAALGGQVYGRRAGWIAAALLAVCTLHVRQSHLAGVDIGMTFWFVGATWAAVRLLQRERTLDYLLAGILVGLAAASKYPGGLAGGAVLAAHLVARRRFFDPRLWAAAGAALACFVAGSPYVLVDFQTFQAHFLHQAVHLKTGHGQALGYGWWYHARFSLVQGLGWPALLAAAAGAFLAWRQRQSGALVLLSGCALFFLVMGAGQTVFVRYVLPLMPLLAVLAAGALVRLKEKKWSLLATLLVLLQPSYNSVRMVHLLGQEDTRAQARIWIESSVPPGTAIGNFGGWAGDIQVKTFEQLWWEILHFEQAFGRTRLDRALDFLESLEAFPPFYSYVVQRSNIAAAAGSMDEIERLETAWVLLHRHPLEASRIDSAFAEQLKDRAELQAQFTAEGLWSANARYDPLDAFYVPLSGFAALAQPGPDIEIWKMRDYPVTQEQKWQVRKLFAQGYVRGAGGMMGTDRIEAALELGERALELDPNCADAHFALAFLHHLQGELDRAEVYYRRCLELRPWDAAAHQNFAMLCETRGEMSRAERLLQKGVDIAPWKESVAESLAAFYLRRGESARAIEVYNDLIDRAPKRFSAYDELGQVYEQANQREQAEKIYQKALEIDAKQEKFYLRLAQLYGEEGRYDQVIAAGEALLQLNPDQIEARRLLAQVYRHLGQMSKAREHARSFIRLAPDDPLAGELGEWLEQNQ